MTKTERAITATEKAIIKAAYVWAGPRSASLGSCDCPSCKLAKAVGNDKSAKLGKA